MINEGPLLQSHGSNMQLCAQMLMVIIGDVIVSLSVLLWTHYCEMCLRAELWMRAHLTGVIAWARPAAAAAVCLWCLSKSWEDHFIIVCLLCLMLLSRRQPLGKWGLAAVFAVCAFFTGLALSVLLLQPVKLLAKVCDTAYKTNILDSGYYSIWWLIKKSLDGRIRLLMLHSNTHTHTQNMAMQSWCVRMFNVF